MAQAGGHQDTPGDAVGNHTASDNTTLPMLTSLG